MITPKEVAQAEETLTKFLSVFRAAGTLQESIDTIKKAVFGYAEIEAQHAAANANLVAAKEALVRVREELSTAQTELESVQAAAGRVKAELRKLGL